VLTTRPFLESWLVAEEQGDLARHRTLLCVQVTSQLRDSAGFAPASLARSVATEATAYPRSVRLVPPAILAFATSVMLGGCAQSGYDTRRLERELERAGVPAAQAQCVTAGLERTFDVQQLGSHSEPTERERQRTRELLAQCGVNRPSPSPAQS
jgi:hypothetical protein